MSAAVEGLLLVDKPRGCTSHDVVAQVRRVLGQPRAGHAGTLDPGATGLLPVALGRATRLVRFLALEPKVYSGELALGVRTTTDDLDGEVVHRHAGPLPVATEVEAACERLVGRVLQIPPSYSAKKIAGTRSYALARRGIDVQPAPVLVEVVRFEVRPASAPDLYRFETAVGAGTYVRGLVRDLGAALGCGAAVVSLRRESLGALRAADSVALPDIRESAVIALPKMPLWPPTLRLDAGAAHRRFATGGAQPVATELPEGPVRVEDDSGAFWGIGEIGAGMLRPTVVLTAAL